MIEYSDKEKKEILGHLLRQRRDFLGSINQGTAADRIGVHKGTYQSWEQGKTLPDTRYLTNIAGFLGLGKVSEFWAALEGTVSLEEIRRKPLEDLIEAIEHLPNAELRQLNLAVAERLSNEYK